MDWINNDFDVHFDNADDAEEVMKNVTFEQLETAVRLDKEVSKLHSAYYILDVATDIAIKKDLEMPKLCVVIDGVEKILKTASSYAGDIARLKYWMKLKNF